MLFYLFILCLSACFLFIKSEGDGVIVVSVSNTQDCTVALPAYHFTEGQNITVIIENEKSINFGWIQRETSFGEKYLVANVTTPESRTFVADKFKEGVWEFEFLQFKDNMNINRTRKRYNNSIYVLSMCRVNVTIVPASVPVDNQNPNKLIIIVSVVGAIALLIILAQAAYIAYLKSKAKALNRHENLSKKSIPSENDTARYCSDPGRKLIKDKIDEDIEQEYIYEAPNIQLPDRLPTNPLHPQIPPLPPAITTMPRTPRSEHNTKIEPQAILAGAMRSLVPSPNKTNCTFPRPKHPEREIHVANRPPLPLPPANGGFTEVYEDMKPEENTYEPPPKITSKTSRPLPGPVNKVPLPVPKPAVDAPKFRPHKTSNTSKPQPLCAPPQNELEQAFKRRNNVRQVSVVSIPEPSTVRGHSTQPRPKPVVKSKPRGPPIPQPVPEEIYSNQQHDSSDEEWTYEPLKPLHGYNANNIYNS